MTPPPPARLRACQARVTSTRPRRIYYIHVRIAQDNLYFDSFASLLGKLSLNSA